MYNSNSSENFVPLVVSCEYRPCVAVRSKTAALFPDFAG